MDYRKGIMEYCPSFDTDTLNQKLGLSGLGIAGEAGEVADILKKVLYHDTPLHALKEKLLKEMGDVYWYLEYLGTTLEISTEAIQGRTAAPSFPVYGEQNKLELLGLRILGKAGKVSEIIENILYGRATLDIAEGELMIQMSNVYWCLEYLAATLGVSPEEIKSINLAKLKARHPNGWTKASQRAKADEKETNNK